MGLGGDLAWGGRLRDPYLESWGGGWEEVEVAPAS